MVEKKRRESHIFDREINDHYVEPHACSRRLFELEKLKGPIYDPCCGWGRIPAMAQTFGFTSIGSDIVDRRTGIFPSSSAFERKDFLNDDIGFRPKSIVANPPFNLFREFAERALDVAEDWAMIAMVCPTRRLAAARWLEDTPLQRIWMMHPRPSMPSGEYIQAGGKVGGGQMDFCWLVWRKSYVYQGKTLWMNLKPKTCAQPDNVDDVDSLPPFQVTS